ncbi:DUF995 domain-containing protein [Agrobacterium salinitolerans]|uniref:DUF995 domain-containing protein n=1 Tax=Agrobacterium salinitolerans TaxID=1183413 RepID=UPI003FCF8425
MKIHPFVFVIATFLFGGMATADNLPQQAVKLTSQEVVAIYSGKTIEWRRSRAVFSPDGTFLLVGKNDEFVASGTWSVRENELCASYELMDLKGSSTKKGKDCWAWYREGKKYWTLWNGDEDKGGGYYDDELDKLSKGDQVTAIYQELMKSN